MFIQSDDNRNANTNIDLRNKVTVTPSIPFLSSSPLSSSSTSSSITLIGQNHNGSFTYSGMTNYSKFDNISSEHPNSSQKWSPDHQYNKSINSNRYSSNKYMRINQYYNMEESITNTIATTPSSSNESKIQIFKSIDNDGSISNTNQIGGICVNNNNSITTNTNNSNSNNIEIDIDLFRYPLREVMNQDLIDLLRSQISKLLEENEKLVSRIDDYRQKIAFIEREKREAAADPSNEVLTLQTELGEARMREAELTIAFEELQHRITAIDRLIETDPEMENFFNAVTISPTNLSLKKPSQTHSSSQNSSPAKYANTHQSPQHNLSDVEDQRMTHDIRSSPYLTDDNPQKVVSPSTNKTIYNRVTNNNNSGRIYSRLQNEAYAGNFNGDTDGEFPRNIQRSGLDSPQSDSGCSLASHTTFDGRDGIVTPASGRGTLAVGMENYDYNNNHGIGRRIAQQHYNPKRDRSRCVGGDDDEEMETESKSNRPRGFVSLLRRSRSSAADHAAMHGFRSELVSPSSNDYSRASIDTPTPTESCVSESEQNDAFTDDRRPGDRLSRLRASLRQSFGWPSSKPDFRMEAFAARQGEARALLKLRETRMDVLRVQSRCQTLQRHIDRLEAINSFRMSELEDAVANDRELRQEIRNLQTRIFQLEAEHREFKVGQRIKEMELMSKLAESNMRLSHAEMTNQQAIVWSQLNKAHEAAADLLTPAHSQTSLVSPCMLTMDSPSVSRYTTATSNNNNMSSNSNANKEDGVENGRNRNNFSSISRYGDLRRDVSGRKSDLSKTTIFTEFSDGQCNSNYDSVIDKRSIKPETISISGQRNQQQQQQHQYHPSCHHTSTSNRDRSVDSLSELR